MEDTLITLTQEEDKFYLYIKQQLITIKISLPTPLVHCDDGIIRYDEENDVNLKYFIFNLNSQIDADDFEFYDKFKITFTDNYINIFYEVMVITLSINCKQQLVDLFNKYHDILNSYPLYYNAYYEF